MAQQKLLNQPLARITRKLAAAVSTIPVGAFLPVVPTANEGEVKLADSANAAIEGYLGTNGVAGQDVDIVIAGVVPVQITGAVDRLQMVCTSANGLIYGVTPVSGTTYNVAGFGRTKATAANEFASVQVVPPQKFRLAS